MLVVGHPEPAAWVLAAENGQQTKTQVLGAVAVIVAVDVPFVFDVCVAFAVSQGSVPTSKFTPPAAAAVAVASTAPAATQIVVTPSVGGAPAYASPAMSRSHQPL